MMKSIIRSWQLTFGVALFALIPISPANAYVYNGQAWCCEGIQFCVNPAEFDTLCAPIGGRDFLTVIQNAAAAWNAQGTAFRLIYNGTTADSACTHDPGGNCIGKQDGQNTVSVLKGCSFPAGVLATSFWWYTVNPGQPDNCCIYEADICFSNDYAWYEDSDPGSCSGTCYDLESLALHEFGHWGALHHEDDEGALGYRPVMFSSYNYCEMRRTITADDAAGLNYAYDQTSVIDVSIRCDWTHNHPPYPGSPKVPVTEQCPASSCSQPCQPGAAFCDSTVADPCLLVCPQSDIVYRVVVKDSCGNPVCDPSGTWLDFAGCPAIPCPLEEPAWPRVFPDSCDPGTGTHYFTIDAGLQSCVDCDAELWINSQFCQTVPARFMDTNGDLCVDATDIQNGPCNDYNCDFALGPGDITIHAAHIGHCCPGSCAPGLPFCDSVTTDPCVQICPMGDEVFNVVVKDSCGNPICDPANTWLDFSNCPAVQCPGEEPNWPIVFPDSCDPATGTHYFSVSASITSCVDCAAELWLNGAYCRDVPTKFFDLNADFCVTVVDWTPITTHPCDPYADFNCNGVAGDIADVVLFTSHTDHCCPGFCSSGVPFCDSVTHDACVLICPQSDIVFEVAVKDSCGDPVCDLAGTWLDFSECPAVPCPGEEPNWPLVYPDSCDSATGIHFFTVDAGAIECVECYATLFVNSQACHPVRALFFDTNGDLCVRPNDFQGGPCNDYSCDFALGPEDDALHAQHLDHCCPSDCSCLLQGDFDADGFIDSVDLSVLIDVVFFGALDPQDPGCPGKRGDFNCDGFTDSVDLSLLIDHVFFGGPPPCDPCNCVLYPTICP